MENAKRSLMDAGLLFFNLGKVTVDENDYRISAASFLALNGNYETALELFSGIPDLNSEDSAFVSYMQGFCYLSMGDKERAENLFRQSYETGEKTISGFRVGLAMLLSEKDYPSQVKGISLIRRAAFLQNVDAIVDMAYLCHDNYKGLPSQDRQQEMFWRDYLVKLITKCSGSIMTHAQNMAGRSYDRSFPKEKYEAVRELAEALKTGMDRKL